MGDFRLRLVGERFPNEDGSSRQDELARCEAGEPVELVREPDNPHDPSAVAVFSCRGVQIGYIGADRCGWIGSKIDRGFEVLAMIHRIDRPSQAGFLGAVLTLSLTPTEGEKHGRSE